MNISIFGGCYCSQKEYEEIYMFIKQKLNRKDIKIINGATIGVMEAVSKAANENKIDVLGFVLDKYKEYVNNYISELYIFDNEFDRLKSVYNNSDIYLVFDGDLGTKEELLIILQQMEKGKSKPIFVLGEKTKKFLEFCFEQGHISKDYKEYLIYVKYNEFNI